MGDVLTDYGRLDATQSSFNQLDAYGCTKLEKCSVQNRAQIYGLLEARSCRFESLSVWSTRISLTNSKVLSDIIVKRIHASKGKQIVELDNTIVEGSILFEKNKGTVILRGTSCVKGEVIGGSIKKE